MPNESSLARDVIMCVGGSIGLVLNLWASIAYVEPALANVPGISRQGASGITALIAVCALPITTGLGAAALLVWSYIPKDCCMRRTDATTTKRGLLLQAPQHPC